jgi:hypothetical protein
MSALTGEYGIAATFDTEDTLHYVPDSELPFYKAEEIVDKQLGQFSQTLGSVRTGAQSAWIPSRQ